MAKKPASVVFNDAMDASAKIALDELQDLTGAKTPADAVRVALEIAEKGERLTLEEALKLTKH